MAVPFTVSSEAGGSPDKMSDNMSGKLSNGEVYSISTALTSK